MIPYLSVPSISIGIFTLSPWGILVALGLILGVAISAREAQARGFDPTLIYNSAANILLAAFVGARLVYVLGYAPDYFFRAPLSFFKFWDGGWSSAGGILGALVAAILVIRRETSTARRYDLADSYAAGFPLGMAVGRLGCFLIHDHLGVPVTSVWAVAFPKGPRYDLGLLESLVMFILALTVVFAAARFRVRPGMLAGFIGLWYALARFGLDFLRATDGLAPEARYLSLTPAQWLMIPLAGLALYVLAPRVKESLKAPVPEIKITTNIGL